MAKKKRYRKPLVKKLQEDMGLVVSEIMMIKNHINDLLQPQMVSFMSLFEKYLEYKNETKEFTLFMEKEAENGQEKIINKKPKERQKKQTKGSGTPKTSGKPS